MKPGAMMTSVSLYKYIWRAEAALLLPLQATAAHLLMLPPLKLHLQSRLHARPPLPYTAAKVMPHAVHVITNKELPKQRCAGAAFARRGEE